jgi:hypothetical protein
LTLAFALLLCGCPTGVETRDAEVVIDASVRDAIAFVECTTFCLRPSDCAVGYTDGDRCPAGFLCARTFSCTPDM